MNIRRCMEIAYLYAPFINKRTRAGVKGIEHLGCRIFCLVGRFGLGKGEALTLLILSMPRHTSSLSSSHALSSTLRRKTLSRLLSASPISTKKGLSCPLYTRYPASQPIPITSRPIQFSPHKPGSAKIRPLLAFLALCSLRSLAASISTAHFSLIRQ
jgi:hypothetical protein